MSLQASNFCPHRLHLYGDIYSSPGITLRQKQLLMAAFLGEANMHDQLFGHLIAVCSLQLPGPSGAAILRRMYECAFREQECQGAQGYISAGAHPAQARLQAGPAEWCRRHSGSG